MKIKYLFLILFLFMVGCTKNEPGWGTGQIFRKDKLSLPIGNGRFGFTSMNPTHTGVTAANQIGEKEVLENQHLMHGSGVALGDVNGDDLIDIYIARIRENNVLYLNKGNWEFEDVSEAAGVSCSSRYSTGAVFADVDGDRDLDLIVTALGGPNSLFINKGDGTFNESRLASNLDNPGSTSSALAYVDNDGDRFIYHQL